MNKKSNIKSYTFQAKVFITELGQAAGVTVNITVFAKNEIAAHKQATEDFNDYVTKLSVNRGRRFSYDNLKLV